MGFGFIVEEFFSFCDISGTIEYFNRTRSGLVIVYMLLLDLVIGIYALGDNARQVVYGS